MPRWMLLVSIAVLGLACDAGSGDAPPVAPPEPGLVVCGEAVAERVTALGAGARVVAADEASRSLPGLRAAASLGAGCDADAASRARADLALLSGPAGEGAERFAARGLRVLVLAPASLNEVVDLHHALGALLGRELRARVLVAEMTSAISQIATRRDGRSRRRVAWLIARDDEHAGWIAVGPSGLLHEILELAGADNAFHASAPGPSRDALRPVDAAALAAASPDLVLVDPGLPQPDLATPVEQAPPGLSRPPILDPVPRVVRLHELLYPAD